MGTFPSWYWISLGICLLPLVLILLYLASRIAHKAGFSRWWALTLLLPGINLFMLSVFAFIPWPCARAPKS